MPSRWRDTLLRRTRSPLPDPAPSDVDPESKDEVAKPDHSQDTAIGRGQNYGITVLYDAGHDAIVDIVFVHGLTGNAYSTWLHAQSGVHWPSTLLKDDVKSSRILAFGYDAGVVSFWGQASTNRLGDHAKALLGDLVRLREDTDTEARKIIFVVHSLGGLVVDKVLSLSRTRAESHLRQLERCTVGILFLGTPHHGSDLAAWAVLGSKLIGKFRNANREILLVLERESEVLRDTQDGFGQLLEMRKSENSKINITCFYEELPVTGAGLIVAQSSATLLGYDDYGIHANHMDMTKFPSADSHDYKKVVGEIRRWVKRLGAVATASQPSLADGGISAGMPPHARVSADNAESHYGRGGTIVSQPQGQLPAPVPKKIFRVLHRRNPYFVGREEEFRRLRESLTSSIDDRLAVMYGLGGSGKTELASTFAHKYRDEFSAVLWITATNTKIASDFAGLSFALKLPEGAELLTSSTSTENDQSSNNIVQARAIYAVREWLEDHESGDWLLIFDNADDIKPADLQAYVPKTSRGSIIITTQNPEMCQLASPEHGIEIRNLAPKDATALLLSRASLESTDENLALAMPIVEALGCLALAVEHAGAYIQSRKIKLSNYLEALRVNKKAKLQAQPSITTHQLSVYATFQLSYDAIKGQSHAAIRCLLIFGFFDGQNIREDVLMHPSLAEHRQGMSFPNDEDALNGAIGELMKYSLIHVSIEGDSRSISLHPLVHYLCHTQLNPGNRLRWLRYATALLIGYLQNVKFGIFAVFQHLVTLFDRCWEVIDEKDDALEAGLGLHLFYLLATSFASWYAAGRFRQLDGHCVRLYKYFDSRDTGEDRRIASILMNIRVVIIGLYGAPGADEKILKDYLISQMTPQALECLGVVSHPLPDPNSQVAEHEDGNAVPEEAFLHTEPPEHYEGMRDSFRTYCIKVAVRGRSRETEMLARLGDGIDTTSARSETLKRYTLSITTREAIEAAYAISEEGLDFMLSMLRKIVDGNPKPVLNSATSSVAVDYANLLTIQGKGADATKTIMAAIYHDPEQAEADILAENSSLYVWIRKALAFSWFSQGNSADALEVLLTTRRILLQKPGFNGLGLAHISMLLRDAYLRPELLSVEESQKYEQQYEEGMDKMFAGSESKVLAAECVSLALALLSQGAVLEAEWFFASYVRQAEQWLGKDHASTKKAQRLLDLARRENKEKLESERRGVPCLRMGLMSFRRDVASL